MFLESLRNMLRNKKLRILLRISVKNYEIFDENSTKNEAV